MAGEGRAGGGSGEGRRRADTRPCPICARPARPRYRPFCSRRCADLDLGRWLKGSYAIPTDETPGEAEPGEDGEEN